MGFFLAIPGALFLLELVRDMEREKIAEREMSNTVQTSDTPFDSLETNIDYTSYDSTS